MRGKPLGSWSVSSLLAALRSIGSSGRGGKNVGQATAIHALAIASGNDSNLFVASSLVAMYSKCGSAARARRVFDSMPFHDVVAWNALILCYADNGEELFALQTFWEMEKIVAPDAATFAAAIRACGGLAIKEQEIGVQLEALEETMRVHRRAARTGLDRDMAVASSLVDVYAKCGSLIDSRIVFDKMVSHDVVAWTSLLLGYADSPIDTGLTLELFSAGWINPNARTFVAAIKACTNLIVGKNNPAALLEGRDLHLRAEKSGFGRDFFLAASLVKFYSKCGKIDEARDVFESIKMPDVVVWNALISGYAENDQGESAYKLFARFVDQRRDGVSPDGVTYTAVLNACIGIASREDQEQDQAQDQEQVLSTTNPIEKAMAIHLQAEKNLACEVVKSSIRNSVMVLYAKCRSLEDSRRVFDRMRCHTLANWTTLVSIYAENDQPELAMEIFRHLLDRFPAAGGRAFIAGLKACVVLEQREQAVRQADGEYLKLASLKILSEIHSQAAIRGVDSDNFVACSLVNLYSRCGSLVEAAKVFENLANPDVASWNAMIFGCVENGRGDSALEFFSRMQSAGCEPDSVTFCAALEAVSVLAGIEADSAKMAALERGMEVHARIRQQRAREEDDLVLSSAIIGMYCKCGDLSDAIRVFDRMQQHDVVSFTSIMLGCVENEEPELALGYFSSMARSNSACKPDSKAFAAALKACCVLADVDEQSSKTKSVNIELLERGMEIHALAAKNRIEFDVSVATALVELYSKCGSMIDARAAFDKMPQRNPATWTSLLLAYAGSGQPDLALELFRSASAECLNALGFVAALKACGVLVSISSAKAVHAEIFRRDLLEDTELLATTLVDVYGKCGKMIDARLVFDSAASGNDAVTWSALIAGYSRWGDSESVLRIFHEMENGLVQPSSSSLLCFLTACSHTGLVDRGARCFEAMVSSKHGISPSLEHYSAMVDLYGRANHLDAALELIRRIPPPMEANAGIWNSLLGSCWKWRNEKVARVAYQALVEMNEADAGAHVTMANICSLRTKNNTYYTNV